MTLIINRNLGIEPKEGEETVSYLLGPQRQGKCTHDIGGPNGGGCYDSCRGLCCSGPCPCAE
ncbi:MAG TPA: hypothetical protein VHH33_08085 [Nitrososphaeraceae archaeon]|jgi:hypothetical protein|nr:hypothetical protein [Nitrososphaeraceae archaeon]